MGKLSNSIKNIAVLTFSRSNALHKNEFYEVLPRVWRRQPSCE